MTKRLEEVLADARQLPPDEQDRVANVLTAFLHGRLEDVAVI